MERVGFIGLGNMGGPMCGHLVEAGYEVIGLETDRRAGKRTLAVRLGRERTRALYTAMVAAAFVLVPLSWLLGSMTAWLLLPWCAVPLALPVAKIVRTRVDGPSLNGALAKTGILQLVFCLLLSAGILLS